MLQKVSITGSNKPKLSKAKDSTLSNHDTAETLKGFIINEPSSAPAKGNKVLQLLKLIQLLLVPPNALQNKYKTQFKMNCELCGQNNHLFKNCYEVLFCKKCKRTNHRTCDHAEFMSFMNINQYHTGQGESSSRSRPSRPTIHFPSCIHCGYNYHKYDDYVYYPICEICGSYDHDTHGHNRIISLRRGIKPRNPQHVTKNCETCGGNVHTTYDHNDIKWFRKREALQAKRGESFKARPDLNGKAVNESQYRGMIGSLMNLTASRPDIQFSTNLYARHQANIRNPTLFLLREFLEKALQMLVSCLKASLFAEVRISNNL
ncbi:hypothetical protein Tco_0527064 [Tanacetum coccineum]